MADAPSPPLGPHELAALHQQIAYGAQKCCHGTACSMGKTPIYLVNTFAKISQLERASGGS